MSGQRRKGIPENPDKDYAIRAARKFIFSLDINWLPVDPFSLYKKCGWLLFSWDQAKIILNDSDPLRLKKEGAEARTSIPRGTDIVVTVYDPSITPFTRIRWTLAHEIGHVILGHLTKYEKTALNRGGLLKKEYQVLEDEADFFAAELLEPMAILKEIGARKPEEIIAVCNVSKQAAENRAIDLAWWGNTRIARESEYTIKLQFKKYLSFVTVCGEIKKLPISDMITRNPGRPNMSKKHSYITVDANGRFTKCPRCGNTDFSEGANFCKMCGQYLYNTCGGKIPQLEDHVEYDDRGNEIHISKINPGDARYCEHCGKETLLTRLGLLMTWEEVVQAHKQVAAGLAPKEQPELADDTEDDLPF